MNRSLWMPVISVRVPHQEGGEADTILWMVELEPSMDEKLIRKAW